VSISVYFTTALARVLVQGTFKRPLTSLWGRAWYNRRKMEKLNNELKAACPHCGSPLDRDARICSNCGHTVDAPPTGRAIPPPVPYIPAAIPAWVTAQEVLSAPATAANQKSVVIALTPRRPATWAFWVGLVMSVGSLVFAICPLLLAMALALDPQSEDPAGFLGGGLLISACVVVGLLVPGIILVVVGRPRRF
jgi:hypothetical protein